MSTQVHKAELSNLVTPTLNIIDSLPLHRNALKSSPNEAIRNLWKDTSNDMNVQYDIYKNTKEILKAVRKK